MIRDLKLKNLEKVYTTEEVETTALNNINLEIKAGEFVEAEYFEKKDELDEL